MVILRLLKPLCLALLMSAACMDDAHAAIGLSGDILTCPYSTNTTALSDDCERHKGLYTVDPQDRELWLFSEFTVPASRLVRSEPIGLFVFGKAASHTYLNDELIGRNGVPGPTAAAEVPGKMYSVIYVPSDHLRAGTNTVAMHMSAHHGWLTLHSPMHAIALADYARPTHQNLQKYWPSLLPFGVLIIGALYMGLLAATRRDHWSSGLLPLMALISALQLYAEVYRAFAEYLYPIHDLRLLLIFSCSLLFGF